MSDSAIHQDVQQEVTQEPNQNNQNNQASAERPKTAREIAMEEMEARHQQQMASENGYQLDQVLNDEPAATAAAAPAPVIDQLAAQMAADNAPAVIPSTIKVKVDGMEADVPLDEVVRQYQKNSSADKRLAEATRLLREAQEAQARLLEQQQLAAQTGSGHAAPADTGAAAEPAADVEQAGKEFLKALFEGDEESALTKLKELTTGGRQAAPVQQPTLDLDQISSAVAQHVQQKLAVESALAKNRADYPQLYADPDIENLAVAKIERLREESGMDFFAALDTVSQEFSTKFGWTQPAAGRHDDSSPTTTSRQAKLERKAAIDNVAAVNTKLTTAESVPDDASSIIAQIKAARGQ